MLYLWLKALHLAAVMTWIGGMILLGLLLLNLKPSDDNRPPALQRLVDAARGWDRRVTSPAMGLAWLLGIWLAVDSGWWGAGWLWAKLCFVVALSALHGMQSGNLRRMATDPAWQPPALLRFSLPFTLASIAAIAALVIVKPF